MEERREENMNEEGPDLITEKGMVGGPKIDNNPDKLVDISKVKKQFNKNSWKVTSVVLGVIVIFLVSIIYNGAGGGVVSEEIIKEKLMEFASAQGTLLEINEIHDMGNFYEIIISVNGQEGPVFISKDGEYFITSLIPLVIPDVTTSFIANPVINLVTIDNNNNSNQQQTFTEISQSNKSGEDKYS